MFGPYLTIDLDKIEHNTRAVVRLCAAHGIRVTGVTKAVCGHPEVARAMLRGGVEAIGDSRMENIRRLRAAGVHSTYVLLRLPPLSGVEEVVRTVDLSLNSELSVLDGLSSAARRLGRRHDVIVMVDMGDLREGVWPGDVVPFLRAALRLPGIRVIGLGTNLACFSGVAPSEEMMRQLVDLANICERSFDIAFNSISGINSSGLELIASGRMPKKVDHARIGEAILLGRETIHRKPWPGTYQDGFVLRAEVLEMKIKPSSPAGIRGEDAFGGAPVFQDRGDMARALLNIGREDVDVSGIAPLDPRLRVEGASSGYLVLDVSRAATPVRVGDELAFSVNYGALLAAMTSEYVEKRPTRTCAKTSTSS